jgi:hypothetical protein
MKLYRVFESEEERKCGYIDRNGSIAIRPQFESGGRFSEGLAGVTVEKLKREAGYIDEAGNFAIPPKFKAPSPFEHGIARVFDDRGRHRFINRKGEFVIVPPDFDRVGAFSEDRAGVLKGKSWGDTRGGHPGGTPGTAWVATLIICNLGHVTRYFKLF